MVDREQLSAGWAHVAAAAARAGGTANMLADAPGGLARWIPIMRLAAYGASAGAPQAVTIAVSCEWANDAVAVGTAHAMAKARWATGSGVCEAEFDVPAGGAQVALAGGADGVELFGRVEGTSTEAFTMRAQAALGAAVHEPAHRTQAVDLTVAGAIDVPLRIPAFANRVQMIALDPTVAGMGALTLEFRGNPVVPLPLATNVGRVPFGSGATYDVPGGSRYWWFRAPPGAIPATTVRAIWELSL